MATVTLTLEEYEALRSMAVNSERLATPTSQPPTLLKKPRKKVSKYNRAFGKHLKALKKKHPRSKTGSLMKRAHALTKKGLKS